MGVSDTIQTQFSLIQEIDDQMHGVAQDTEAASKEAVAMSNQNRYFFKRSIEVYIPLI